MNRSFARQWRSRGVIVLCSMVVCWLVSTAQATVIVLVRTQNEVVLAADRKVLFRGNGLPTHAGSVCKIYRVGDGFFALAGLANFPDDSSSIVAGELQRGGKPADAIARAAETLRSSLVTALPRLAQIDPDGYRQIRESKGAVGIAAAMLSEGSPISIYASIDLSTSDVGSIEMAVASGKEVKWRALGSTAAIQRLFDSGKVPSLRPAELARYLVRYEINAGDPNVGLPVDVVDVSPSGASWPWPEPGCPLSK